MPGEDSYQPGQTAFYHEDGEVDEVVIMANKSDKEWIRYDLEVRKVLHEGGFVKPAKSGDRAVVEKKRGADCCGLWNLLDEE